MFKKLLKMGLEKIEGWVELLREAYDDTYGCEELTSEIYAEIERRKRINEIKTKERIAARLQDLNLANAGYFMTECQLYNATEEKFRQGKEQGFIDILNNFIERSNDE
jgi:hypothetical protein